MLPTRRDAGYSTAMLVIFTVVLVLAILVIFGALHIAVN